MEQQHALALFIGMFGKLVEVTANMVWDESVAAENDGVISLTNQMTIRRHRDYVAEKYNEFVRDYLAGYDCTSYPIACREELKEG
ncbi:hypothetical protein [Litorivivens sp.]|uniref:hypothetical protein n=1 Tax=Litorivivens sp. TaxID=2020868 RepID=UPI00356711DF